MEKHMNPSNEMVFYQYPGVKPAEIGVYECIDFSNMRVFLEWDGEKFKGINKNMIHFFKSNKCVFEKPDIEKFNELR